MKNSRFYYSPETFKTEMIAVPTNEFDEYGNQQMMIAGFANSKRIQMPRLSICGVIDTETNVMSFGVAVCSEKDRFERKIGRKLAEQRALTNPFTTIENVQKEIVSETFIQVAKELELTFFNTKKFNRWAIR